MRLRFLATICLVATVVAQTPPPSGATSEAAAEPTAGVDSSGHKPEPTRPKKPKPASKPMNWSAIAAFAALIAAFIVPLYLLSRTQSEEQRKKVPAAR